MKAIFVLLLVTLSFPTSNASTIKAEPEPFFGAVTSILHACFLSPTELRCYGSNIYGEAPRSLRFESARVVETEYSHTCVAEKDEVWCIGQDEEITFVPNRLAGVHSLAMGFGFACALNDQVHCWGEKDEVPVLPTHTGKVIKIDASGHQLCHLYSDAVVCGRDGEEIEKITVQNAIDLTVGKHHVCVLERLEEENRVRCFSTSVHFEDHGQLDVPPLDRPENLSGGNHTSCARVYTGFNCWGKQAEYFHDVTAIDVEDFSVCGVRRDSFFCKGILEDRVPKKLVAPTEIMATGNLSCARDAGSWTCWGDSQTYFKEYPSPLVEPAGFNYAGHCWIENNKVECIGTFAGGAEPPPPPPLSNPKFVTVNSNSCAIDETGLVCWGWPIKNRGFSFGQLRSPTIAATTATHVCAASSEKLKCRGIYSGNTREFLIKNLRQLVSGTHHFCLLDDSGVRCWEGDLELKVIPKMKNVQSVCTGDDFSCAVHGSEVSCWGKKRDLISQIPSLTRPTEVACGFNHACVLDGTRVKCWGKDTSGQASPPY